MRKMVRFLLLLVLVQSVVAITEPSLDEIISEIFGISDSEDDNEVSLSGCNDLEGKGRGCLECYFCNHTLIRDSGLKGGHVELQLKDSTCSTTQICCVTQQDLVNYRSSEVCGKSNPDGKPRKRRSAPRAVLQGEFPWRAWVYKKNSHTPLCAATFVHEDTMALLTLASCLQGLSADAVEVAFARSGKRAAVSQIIVHESFRAGEDINNIAILRLRSWESMPDWASPACLPLTPPSHAAPCLTTSDKDIRLNTVIPLRTACTETREPPPDSLTCAVAPPKDYPPEKATGLFCKEQHVTSPAYIVHGLAIRTQDDSVATYVNVWHFSKWINKQLGIAS